MPVSARNTPCQVVTSRSIAPSTGATAGAMSIIDCTVARTTIRRLPPNTSFTMAVATAVTAPLPTAWKLRKRISSAIPPEQEHKKLATIYMPRPVNRTGLRPYLSLRGPQNRVPRP